MPKGEPVAAKPSAVSGKNMYGFKSLRRPRNRALERGNTFPACWYVDPRRLSGREGGHLTSRVSNTQHQALSETRLPVFEQ